MTKPRNRRVIRVEIRDRLIDDITNGRLAAGVRLVETRLAEQFGVSQTPVREALRDLAILGFVVSSPFRGTTVRRLSTRDLTEMYRVRAVLEGLAARTAAARIDDGSLAELERLIDLMRDASRRGDRSAHVDADFAFHYAVVKASGNLMLEQVWQTLCLATTTAVTHAMSRVTRRSMHEIGDRHAAVLLALRTRDPIKAEAAMRAHIEEPAEWIVNGLDRENDSTVQDQEAAG